ncbi:MAG: hypothetical protein PUP91_01625 [Rhizonema sp. PD37]|nr:hypothetical protein [Rhizonema sp. PD37]
MSNYNGNDDRSTREILDDFILKVDDFMSTANQVLARSAVLDDVVLEIRDTTEQHQRNFEQHQRNFEEHQRSTNAAIERLEAILLQLIPKGE